MPPEHPCDEDVEPSWLPRLEVHLRRIIREEFARQEREAEWLETVDAASHLRVHPKTLARYVREGRIPASKVGSSYRFRRSHLDAYLREQAGPR